MLKALAVKSIHWFVLGLVLMLTTTGIFATAFAQGGDAARGKQLYQQNCAVCHGENAQGRVGARLAKDFPGIRVDASLNETISNGVTGSVMPAWSQAKGGPLDADQINDLVAYIRSLGHQAPPVPTGLITPTTAPPAPSPAATFPAGNSQRGASIFAQNCAICHGDRGEGRVGATLQKEWPGIDPQSFIEATVARGVPGSKMPAWAKSNGGPLTDQDIADAAAFVRTLKPSAQATTAAPAEASPGGLLGSPIALVCAGLIVLLLIGVLGIGLAGSRSRAV